MRVLKWIFGRIDQTAQATETALGFMPEYQDMDWKGLEFNQVQFQKVMNIDSTQWMKEVLSHKEFFQILEKSVPLEFLNIQENNFVSLAKMNDKTRLSDLMN
jgi:phosphoenolpyruvate carboxykinase (GTP)